jgi:1-acyl-sn-glycerol-3-phosphate acyltransferase
MTAAPQRADPVSRGWYCLVRDSFRLVFRTCYRFKVMGGEHVPETGGVILAANHVSYLDPAVLTCGNLRRTVRYLARDSLFRNPIFGGLLRRVGALPMSRERGDVGALRMAIHQLRAGACIGIFPEGTRSPDGELKEGKGGIGFLIAKAGVPVVPAYIQGTFQAFPRGARFLRPARIQVLFGEPITPAEIAAMGSEREVYEQITALVMNRIKLLKYSMMSKNTPAGAAS